MARLRLDPQLEVVGEASNGAEVITKVGELNPTALILDLQMPVMSGEEAIPILRSLAPQLRIVAFSAFVGVQEGLSGSWCPDAEIAKGGDLKDLIQAVHRLLADRLDDVIALDSIARRVAQDMILSTPAFAASAVMVSVRTTPLT